VEKSSDVQWRPMAAYLYVLHLDGAALAWEYLRRNPNYRRDWLRRHQRQHATVRWGLRVFEDPKRDGREAQPDWQLDHDAVLVQPDADPPPDAVPFRLWHLPGRKQLLHDGQHLMLASRLVERMLHLAISPVLEDGAAYVFAVRAGERLRERWHAAETDLALLDAAQESRTAVVLGRPSRTTLSHMRVLQALDGVLAGASQRTVAEVLFGDAAVAARWEADGDLRAQVRRLIRRGRVLMQGDYLRLLPPGASA
jgi:hypothetical protein